MTCKKQKILIVHNYYKMPGGEDIVAANEKSLLEKNGHEVVFYSRNNAEINDFTKIQKFLFPFTVIFSLKTYREIKKIIIEKSIDIVHIHNTLSLISPSVYYAAIHCKVPVIQTSHNFRLLCPGAELYRDGNICEDCVKNGWRSAVKHKCYRESRFQTLGCIASIGIHKMFGIYKKIHFICLTEFNKEKILLLNQSDKKRIVDPDKVFIKPNFAYDHSHDHGTYTNEYYLFVGRVEKIKGLDILLDAFISMPEEKLEIAGAGTELERCRKKVTEAKAENICFRGFQNRDQLKEAVSKAKAVIVPSQWYETFGLIIAEAYAGHKPVIAGDIGNIAGLVESEKTGLKFVYNSSEDLIQKVKKFNNSPTDEWGENAYKKYKAEFSPEHNYRQLLAIYDAIDGA